MADFLPPILERFRVTPDTRRRILEDIALGSTPGLGFYALISTSSLIASLGLVANSPAVIIGAMLVSPLMSPIFGISLGMLRGDANLLTKAIRAEASGVVLAVAFGALFGLLPVMTEVTPEMLARTEPTLLDLLVAVFAGFAGTLAMVDERISPALPGVAIATAIVPPLATCGLCLAAGATKGASGALLLFFANFVAILLVGCMTFLATGMARRREGDGVTGNLVIAVLCFLLVSAYLTNTLVGIVTERRQDRQVKSIIETLLSNEPNASMVSFKRREVDGVQQVLATVRASKAFDPLSVEGMQRALAGKLGKKVNLAVRFLITKDIFPPGAVQVVAPPNLSGALFTENVPEDVKRLELAEQTLREQLTAYPQLLLLDVSLFHISGDPVVLATLQSPRALIPQEAAMLENAVRERLKDPSVRLLTRCQVSVDVTPTGRILFGRAHFGQPEEGVKAVEDVIRNAVAGLPDMFVTAMDVLRSEGGFKARAEIAGARLITPAEIRDIESRASAEVKVPVHLAAWSKVDLMVTGKQSLPLEEYTRRNLFGRREVIVD